MLLHFNLPICALLFISNLSAQYLKSPDKEPSVNSRMPLQRQKICGGKRWNVNKVEIIMITKIGFEESFGWEKGNVWKDLEEDFVRMGQKWPRLCHRMASNGIARLKLRNEWEPKSHQEVLYMSAMIWIQVGELSFCVFVKNQLIGRWKHVKIDKDLVEFKFL